MKRYAALTVVMLLILGFMVGFGSSQSDAKDNSEFETTINNVGTFISSNKNLFLKGLDISSEKSSENVVCWVNGVPVSNDELQVRLKLNQLSGKGPQTIDDVKKRLIREKVILKEAEKQGVIPTNKEIDKFLEMEKNQMQTIPEFREGVEKIIDAWGLTEEEYWNVYERYNAYRILMLEKLGKKIIPDFYEKEKITFDDDKAAKAKFDNHIKEKLAEAEIKENPNFK